MSIMEGPLYKWTNVVKGYQLRFFKLDKANGLFTYCTSKGKLDRGERRGCIRLETAILGIEDHDETIFTISADGKVFHCKATSLKERDKWINALQETIVEHTHRRQMSFAYKHKPTLERFNAKLTETDTYLQILINQIKNLDTKLEHEESEKKRNQLLVLKEKSTDFLDSVKHTIVLLQLAKNVQYPVNGHLDKSSENQFDIIPGADIVGESNDTSQESIIQVNNTTPTTAIPKGLVKPIGRESDIPELSYGSSEDDDDDDDNDFFYDADEGSVDNDKMILKHSLSGVSDADAIDYDLMHESDNEEEYDEVIQPHGSIISHLLSQVKIGMDLTKVTLPTFILETRSLLEMYADFFTHADIFVSIPDFETPQERMIQVVRWYLSAFHAGRKGSVPKKPYNPILGETFKCYWDLSNGKETSTTKPASDGPIPWAQSGDLTFIAEQVSHHPPISAFYAESIDKRIMCCAHIWTKSKFLGLSIGVNNAGLGTIYLLERGEEYTCTFPSAYGRSILTEPWFEMGGPVDIVCAQTGYSAKLDFHTKPFYGGKKHQISAEVFGPLPTKKQILKISGEWNGRMMAKTPNGKSELFVDTKALPSIRKVVRPISQQEDYESRNLWKMVTAALKGQNVSEATAAKFAIEQQQRNLAKEREECSTAWQNRAFKSPDGEMWMYNNPLKERIPLQQQ